MKTIISVLAAMVAATVSLAAATPALTEQVEEIVSSGETPAAVLIVWKDDSPVFEAAAGCAQLRAGGDCAAPMTLETKFRVASISKMAASFAAISMARDGLVDLDAEISAHDGKPVRNPAYPDRAITLRHLLSHTSTIRDPAAYWVAAPGDFSSILSDPAVFTPDDGAPGAYFTYANLNFGLAAGVLERAGAKRFDEIFSDRVAEPLGLDIGFNWSGVSREMRRSGATLYRKADGVWTPQTDGQDILEMRGPYFLAEEGLDRDGYLSAYEPGANPTLFSPQGGLRANVRDLARLVSLLRPGAMFEEAATWQWRHEDDNGDTLGQLMLAYGLGVHEAPAPGRDALLTGHSGEAYGLFSGAWIVCGTPYVIAYAVTGSVLPDSPGEIPGFTDLEKKLLNIAFDAIALDETQDDVIAQ